MATILIVDDRKNDRDILTHCLTRYGHVLWTAESGHTALERLSFEQPDLVFLDMKMVGMSGIEVLKTLKSDSALRHIPVIMVSAANSDEEIVEALKLGANDYVSKPFSFTVLAARLDTSLKLKRAQDELRQANQRLEVMATIDLLTGLNNQRHFYELSNKELDKAQRFERPLVMMFMENDQLQQINQAYGNFAGDKVLMQFSQLCKKNTQKSDILGRLGGGQFAWCMPDTALADAQLVAENMRQQAMNIPHLLSELFDNGKITTTISMGLSLLSQNDNDIAVLSRRTNNALIQAKQSGGDQLHSSEEL